MPNVFLRSKPTRLDPEELAIRLREALAQATPSTAFTVHVDPPEVGVAWEDGPATGTVAEVVATLVNWEVRTAASPAARAGAPAVVLHRSFSERALAVAVVRYQGSNVRPYDSTSERAVAALVELLEVDDPGRSGYRVPDAMADLLLAAPDPDGLAGTLPVGASPADRLAAKLAAVGYDRLWSTAWSAVT